MGHVRQSADPSNTARVVALMADIPETVPAYTIHRQCGSGLQAVMDAAQLIRCGEAEAIVAGGTENMSQAVYFIRNARHGLGTGDHPIEDSLVAGGPGSVPAEIYGHLPMGITAENLADKYGIPREEQDRFALESQVKDGPGDHARGASGRRSSPSRSSLRTARRRSSTRTSIRG